MWKQRTEPYFVFFDVPAREEHQPAGLLEWRPDCLQARVCAQSLPHARELRVSELPEPPNTPRPHTNGLRLPVVSQLQKSLYGVGVGGRLDCADANGAGGPRAIVYPGRSLSHNGLTDQSMPALIMTIEQLQHLRQLMYVR